MSLANWLYLGYRLLTLLLRSGRLMLCKVLPGEIFPWFVRFWNAGTCFKFCDLFPGVNNAVIVNSCLVCEEGFEVWLFCKAYCFSLFSISEF